RNTRRRACATPTRASACAYRSTSILRSPCLRSLGLFVFADHELVGGELIGRHNEIERRGRALEDATGEIELRAMARAIKAAGPVRAHFGFGIGRLLLRRAAEVGADADQHEN